MKKVCIALAAVSLISTAAFSQVEPTTVKNEHLKGNVLSVAYTKYDYMENFGEPTEGKIQEQSAIIFDEQGRSVLIRKKKGYLPLSFVLSYSQDGADTKINIAKLSGDRMDENSFAQLASDPSGALEGAYNQNNWPQIRGEITSDASGVIVKYDIFEKKAQTVNEALICRRIAKRSGNGLYACKIYNVRGETEFDFKETYKDGVLTFLDNPSEFMHISSGDIKLRPRHAGTYEYNTTGLVTKYVQQNKNMPMEYLYSYNDEGDLTKVTCGQAGKGEKYQNLEEEYDNYRYDDHGNWIYRTVAYEQGKPKYIEKRQITYCSSPDEIKQKLSGLNVTVPDVKAGEDYANFFNKHLKNGNFKVEIPLTQYYPELASEKGADKMTAFIVVGFYAGYDGAFSLRVDMPTKTTAKMEKLAAQYTVERTKYKYEYKDGVLTMNNEEYKIDSAGNLINTKRNVTFTRF